MSYVILATPCAYFLQLPVDTYAPLVLAGAGHRKSTEIWSRRMRTLFTYRSHFGSRYHTRADAVTQAFLGQKVSGSNSIDDAAALHEQKELFLPPRPQDISLPGSTTASQPYYKSGLADDGNSGMRNANTETSGSMMWLCVQVVR